MPFNLCILLTFYLITFNKIKIRFSLIRNYVTEPVFPLYSSNVKLIADEDDGGYQRCSANENLTPVACGSVSIFTLPWPGFAS